MPLANDIKYAVQMLIKYPSYFGKELDKQIEAMTEDEVANTWHTVGGFSYMLGVKHTANIRRKHGG